jgi:hypothetical protein
VQNIEEGQSVSNSCLPDRGGGAHHRRGAERGRQLLAPQGDARSAIASAGYYPAGVAVLLGGLLVMASWAAVYLRQRAESGILGFAGMAAVFAAGVPLTVGFPLIQLLVLPWTATTSVSGKSLDAGPVSWPGG